MTATVEVPEVAWVFACSTALGSVAPGVGDFRLNGRVIPYHPRGSIGAGSRWCSRAWLQRHPDQRGNPARLQGMASHIGFTRRGLTLSPYILVVPDDALEQAARTLAEAVHAPSSHPEHLDAWAFAVVRLAGRTRFGVRLRGPGVTTLSNRLAAEVGVDWRFWFDHGGNTPTGVRPDTCTIASGDGTPLVTWRDGVILLEEEPVSDEFLALADRYGNGFAVARQLGWELRLPSDQNRTLAPDELAVARTYLDQPDGAVDA
jgi:hypothetical protein